MSTERQSRLRKYRGSAPFFLGMKDWVFQNQPELLDLGPIALRRRVLKSANSARTAISIITIPPAAPGISGDRQGSLSIRRRADRKASPKPHQMKHGQAQRFCQSVWRGSAQQTADRARRKNLLIDPKKSIHPRTHAEQALAAPVHDSQDLAKVAAALKLPALPGQAL